MFTRTRDNLWVIRYSMDKAFSVIMLTLDYGYRLLDAEELEEENPTLLGDEEEEEKKKEEEEEEEIV